MACSDQSPLAARDHEFCKVDSCFVGSLQNTLLPLKCACSCVQLCRPSQDTPNYPGIPGVTVPMTTGLGKEENPLHSRRV